MKYVNWAIAFSVTILVKVFVGAYALMLALGVLWLEFGLLRPLGYRDAVGVAVAGAFVYFVYSFQANFQVTLD